LTFFSSSAGAGAAGGGGSGIYDDNVSTGTEAKIRGVLFYSYLNLVSDFIIVGLSCFRLFGMQPGFIYDMNNDIIDQGQDLYSSSSSSVSLPSVTAYMNRWNVLR
jgi:hypothetical protein